MYLLFYSKIYYIIISPLSIVKNAQNIFILFINVYFSVSFPELLSYAYNYAAAPYQFAHMFWILTILIQNKQYFIKKYPTHLIAPHVKCIPCSHHHILYVCVVVYIQYPFMLVWFFSANLWYYCSFSCFTYTLYILIFPPVN